MKGHQMLRINVIRNVTQPPVTEEEAAASASASAVGQIYRQACPRRNGSCGIRKTQNERVECERRWKFSESDTEKQNENGINVTL